MSKTGRPLASIPGVTLIVVLASLSQAEAAPISIPVECQGRTVGTIDVDVQTAVDGGKTVEGVVGAFNVAQPPIPRVKPTLKEVATFCKEDHFNWSQVIVYDSALPGAPPYLDPPHGGYPNQWADDLDWYWDEKKPDPLPATFEQRFQLSEHTHEFSLDYRDFPRPPVGQFLQILTLLVSLDKDGNALHYHGGFEWFINRPDENTTDVYKIDVFQTPEPGTLSLSLLAAVVLGVLKPKRWRRRFAG